MKLHETMDGTRKIKHANDQAEAKQTPPQPRNNSDETEKSVYFEDTMKPNRLNAA
ncbi:MAG: hypothetical protein ACI89U_002809 [Gammaproteobacteria bacterium]|jgi:hypothetical protein